MKKLILLLSCVLMAINSYAQLGDNGSINGPFVVKSSSVAVRGIAYSTTALYGNNGTTLVSVLYYDAGYAVSATPGTLAIAPNALLKASKTENISHVYLTSTVVTLYPTSLLCNYYNETNGYGNWVQTQPLVDITDDIDEATNVSAPPTKTDETAEETARYNLQGQQLNEPQRGVNIVRMSDNTAHKTLVR